jgi:hypothetical protein
MIRTTLYQNVLTTLLDLYLQEGHTKGQLTDELNEMLRDFIATSFMGNQGKLLGHHYHSTTALLIPHAVGSAVWTCIYYAISSGGVR